MHCFLLYKQGLLKLHQCQIPWLYTHDPSLRSSKQDEFEPTAWVIPGPITCVHKNKTQVFLLGLIDVLNRAENERDFNVNAQAHKTRVLKVDTIFFSISSKEKKNRVVMV